MLRPPRDWVRFVLSFRPSDVEQYQRSPVSRSLPISFCLCFRASVMDSGLLPFEDDDEDDEDLVFDLPFASRSSFFCFSPLCFRMPLNGCIFLKIGDGAGDGADDGASPPRFLRRNHFRFGGFTAFSSLSLFSVRFFHNGLRIDEMCGNTGVDGNDGSPARTKTV